MAIIIEEDKTRADYTNWIGWFAILLVVAAAAYYLVFAAPPAPAVVTPPPGFRDISPIAQLRFNSVDLAQNALFQSLRQSVAEPTSTGPGTVGRTNPFVSP